MSALVATETEIQPANVFSDDSKIIYRAGDVACPDNNMAALTFYEALDFFGSISRGWRVTVWSDQSNGRLMRLDKNTQRDTSASKIIFQRLVSEGFRPAEWQHLDLNTAWRTKKFWP